MKNYISSAFFFVSILKKNLLFDSNFKIFPIQYFELTVGIRPNTNGTYIGYQEYDDETGVGFGKINPKELNLPSGEITRIYYFESITSASASIKTEFLSYFINKREYNELKLANYSTIKLSRLDSNKSIYITSINYTEYNFNFKHFTNAFFNQNDISHTMQITLEFL